MKFSISKSLKKCGLIAVMFAMVTACQDDNDSSSLSPEEVRLQSAIAAEETNGMIAVAQEAIEITSDVLDSEGVTSGRAVESVDSKKGHYDHHGCDPEITTSYNVDHSRRDTVIYTGTIKVNYGNGGTCDPDHVRKGVIVNSFKYTFIWGENLSWSAVERMSSKKYVSDSTYTNGGVEVTSRKGAKSLKFTLTMIDYRDGLTRVSSARLKFAYHSNNTFKWKDNTITVTGTGSGISRHGHTYECLITEDLLFKYACDKRHRFYPVKGEVRGLINGTEFFMSCGDGECDREYTITMNGETTTHEFGKED
jgi:hypothetical protein